tara:strand:+ start:207 stop:770 length:564 start_codon:yes stop_codon:yes gene_type:complete
MAFKMRGYTAGEGTGSMAKQKKQKEEILNKLGKGVYDKLTEVTPGNKVKNKGKMEGPIPEQNIKHQDGNEDGTWIYGRGYKGEDPKKGLAEMKSDEKQLNSNKKIKPNSGTEYVKSERLNDYDSRAGVIEQNELQDEDWYLGGAKESDSFIVKRKAAKKGAKKRKSLKKTVKTLDREAKIMRDRTDK